MPNSNIITPIGPISGLEIKEIRLLLGLCLSDSFLEFSDELIFFTKKKWVKKSPTSQKN
jgi:hypothetical protein